MADSDSRVGAVYFDRAILDYAATLHAPHDRALEAAFTAPARSGLPPIQLGASEAHLLTLLLRLTGARKVVEVGTLAGYSALRLARGLPPEGKVWTLEVSPRHAEVARALVAQAGEASRVEVLTGDAAELLPGLERHGPFCAVFIDADKGRYDVYGRWAAANLRRGGLLLADNAFLFGRLLEDSDEARAMRRCHEEAARAMDTVCIPTPDGLLLGVKR
jgi:caffeoyl-CoA O-methyltransferase